MAPPILARLVAVRPIPGRQPGGADNGETNDGKYGSGAGGSSVSNTSSGSNIDGARLLEGEGEGWLALAGRGPRAEPRAPREAVSPTKAASRGAQRAVAIPAALRAVAPPPQPPQLVAFPLAITLEPQTNTLEPQSTKLEPQENTLEAQVLVLGLRSPGAGGSRAAPRGRCYASLPPRGRADSSSSSGSSPLGSPAARRGRNYAALAPRGRAGSSGSSVGSHESAESQASVRSGPGTVKLRRPRALVRCRSDSSAAGQDLHEWTGGAGAGASAGAGAGADAGVVLTLEELAAPVSKKKKWAPAPRGGLARTLKDPTKVERCDCNLEYCMALRRARRNARVDGADVSFVPLFSVAHAAGVREARPQIFGMLRKGLPMPCESSTQQFKWWHLAPDSFDFDPKRALWKTKPGLGKTAVADLRKVPRDGELSEWNGQAWVRPGADDGEDLSMVLLPPGAKIEQPLKRTAHVEDGHRSTSLRILSDSSSEDD